MRRLNSLRRLQGLHVVLFLGSLLICLWWGLGPLNGQGGIDRAAATDAPQLTQQGWEQYQSGDLQGAIARWQTALSLTTDASELRATVLKYLVRADQQVGAMDDAIAHLSQLIAYYRQTNNSRQVGRMMIEQAQVYTSLGQQRRAIALLCGELVRSCSPDSAMTIAQRHGDSLGEMAALGSLGNAYRLRGDYDRALQYLTLTLKLAEQTHRSAYTLAALNGLGNTYINLAQRDDRRRQSAQQSDDDVEAQSLAQRVNHYNRQAIRYFEASVKVARAEKDTQNELRSLLNLVAPLQRLQLGLKEDQDQHRGTEAILSASGLTPASALQQVQSLVEGLPASREKAYAAIRLATLMQLVRGQTVLDPATHCVGTEEPSPVIAWLRQAVTIAQQIRDPQSEAFALGRLGHVYECRQNYEQALALTQQAQLVSANDDSRYLWEWQAGRIFRAQHKIPAAIAAYNLAVKTLQTIRGELAIASRDFQFDFRDTVEPVYRELTALYLDQATLRQVQAQRQLDSGQLDSGQLDSKSKGESSTTLASVATVESALETIDSLRLAELQNYLGEDCTLNTIAKPVTVIDPKTAVLSSVILGEQVAVILTLPLPDQRFRSQVRWLPTDAQTVTATINNLRRRLEKRSDLADTYQEPSQQLYDWLIAPFAQTLETAHIETLVFIQDGILRSVPMAALYDGKQFLVEQYAIASTLSLTLIDPMPLDRASLRVLGFGLTQPAVVDGPTFFSPLSYVKAEISSIEHALPGSKGLLDDAFTVDRVQQELTQNAYPIVHLATHGRFGIDARDTFLVTGKKVREGSEESGEKKGKPETNRSAAPTPAYNEKLTMNALYQMLRSVGQERVLELLTLTACETAVGSDRDALGIAGISLHAGARSAVASLWQVDDAATAQLITHFYQALKQGMSRAKALQTAQKNWLQQHTGDRHHPGYWAALILVGNWL